MAWPSFTLGEARHDTRAETLTAPSMKANYHHFLEQVSVTKGESSTIEKLSAPSLRCASKMAMSWCAMETSQCLGGDTRAVVSRLGWA